MKTLFGITSLIIAVGMTACLDSSNDDKSDPTIEANETKTFTEKYRFRFNGCDTGKQVFTANSQEEVIENMCEGLLEEERNKFCAHDLRKIHFEIHCPGKPWVLKFPDPGEPSNPPNPSNPSQWELEDRLRQHLYYAIAKTSIQNKDLPAEYYNLSSKIIYDINSCGFSYLGPKCLDYSPLSGWSSGEYIEDGESGLFAVVVNIAGMEDQLVLSFKVTKENEKYYVPEVEIFKTLKDFSNGDLTLDDIKNQWRLALLATIELDTDMDAAIATRLLSPIDFRQLYHMATQSVLRAPYLGNNPDLQEHIMDRIMDKRNMVSSSDLYEYHRRTFLLAANNLNPEPATKALLAETIMAAPNQQSKYFGAIHLLNNDTTQVELKEMVKEGARETEDSALKKVALSAIDQADRKVEDELFILSFMQDDDFQLTQFAYKLGEFFTLTDSHLPVLEIIAEEGSASARKNAISLISKIDTYAAKTALINKVNDDDFQVRVEALKQLQEKTLTVADLDNLTDALETEHDHARKAIIELIGTIPGEDATIIIVSQLSDKDFQVRVSVIEQMQNRELTSSIITSLIGQLKNNEHNHAREAAAKLLGKSDSQGAIKGLITNMSDKDFQVRVAISDILLNKNLGDSNVLDLSGNFSSDHDDVRLRVAELLGKIPTTLSLSVLEARLKIETEFQVKQQIEASIAKIK